MHPTLLLAKSQPLALNYWKAQLEEAGYTVLPFCKKASDWLSVIRQTKPYLLFIEATFANNTGLELVRQTRLLHPATRCVVCVPALPAYYLKAIEVDASGYLPDNIGDPAEVLHCFEQVGQGYRYISPIFSAVLPLPPSRNKKRSMRYLTVIGRYCALSPRDIRPGRLVSN
ncbi:response regulator [Spirosoma montaniterrae]|uniref:response regulator n=1 Tax=Spirosoma montaniterrae TaxID=1178516 RepID=UPI0012F78268|nr:response regulator [Spirosoma montaniterrae]